MKTIKKDQSIWNKAVKKIFLTTTLVISIITLIVGTYFVTRIQEQARKSNASGDVSINFEPSEITSDVNTTLDGKLVINPMAETVSAVELHLTFDVTKLKVVSLTNSATFPTVLEPAIIDNDLGTASIIIGASPTSPVTALSDLVNIQILTKDVYNDALINVDTTSQVAAFGKDTSVLGTFGTMTIHILTTAAPTPTSTSVATAIATATSVATTEPTATAVATATPTDPPIGGGDEPNSCGGTCGSNYNCKANLYCYNGYCRNPLCSDTTNCNCSDSTSTSAPTNKSTVKPATTNKTATLKPLVLPKVTTKPVSAATYVPGITKNELNSDDPSLTRVTDETAAVPENVFSKYIMYIFGGFVLLVILAIYFAVKKSRDASAPHIMPPTNI